MPHVTGWSFDDVTRYLSDHRLTVRLEDGKPSLVSPPFTSERVIAAVLPALREHMAYVLDMLRDPDNKRGVWSAYTNSPDVTDSIPPDEEICQRRWDVVVSVILRAGATNRMMWVLHASGLAESWHALKGEKLYRGADRFPRTVTHVCVEGDADPPDGPGWTPLAKFPVDPVAIERESIIRSRRAYYASRDRSRPQR